MKFKTTAHHLIKLYALFFLTHTSFSIHSQETTPIKNLISLTSEKQKNILPIRGQKSNCKHSVNEKFSQNSLSISSDNFTPFPGTRSELRGIDFLRPLKIITLPLRNQNSPDPAFLAEINIPIDFQKEGTDWSIKINGFINGDLLMNHKKEVISLFVAGEIARNRKALSRLHPYSDFSKVKTIKIKKHKKRDGLTPVTFNIPGSPHILKKKDTFLLKISRPKPLTSHNFTGDFLVSNIEFVYNKKRKSSNQQSFQKQATTQSIGGISGYFDSYGKIISLVPATIPYSFGSSSENTPFGYLITPGNYGGDEMEIPEQNGVYADQGLNYIVCTIDGASQDYETPSGGIISSPLYIYGNILTSGGNGGCTTYGNPNISGSGGGGAGGYFIQYQITPNTPPSATNPFIVSLGISLADTATFSNSISNDQSPCGLTIGIGNISEKENNFNNLSEAITINIPGGNIVNTNTQTTPAGVEGNNAGDYWDVSLLNGQGGGPQATDCGLGGTYHWNSNSEPKYTFTIKQPSYTVTYTYLNPVESDTTSGSCLSAYGGSYQSTPSTQCNGISGNTPFYNNFSTPILSNVNSPLQICSGGGAGGILIYNPDPESTTGATPGTGSGRSLSSGGCGGFPYGYDSTGVLAYNASITNQGVPPTTLALGSGGGGNGATYGSQESDLPEYAGYGSAGFASVYLYSPELITTAN